MAAADEVHRVVSTAIDLAFYRAVYPELDRSGLDLIRHYVEHGWREGRDPAPWFSTQLYLQRHPDVAASGEEPLAHYLRCGAAEGREVFPSAHAKAYAGGAGEGRPFWAYEPYGAAPAEAAPEAEPEPPPEDPPLFSEADRELAAAEFDPDFYLENNPDVADGAVDPLEHFLAHGWREGRDPNVEFSVFDYLQANADVAAADVNPFLHYLSSGRAEGRAPRSTLGFRHRILTRLRSVDERVARAERGARRARPRDAEALVKALAKSRSPGRDLHITFSHDDYLANVGGVQLCLRRESAAFAQIGCDHLHLFPSSWWPVARVGERAALGVIWNGKRVGVFTPEAVVAAVRGLSASGGRRSFAIHSLLGHSVDEVSAVLAAAGLRAGYFWLHDFASLCAGVHLLRNDVEDCGAPPPESQACGICVYGDWRARHLREHARLFERFQLTVVSPSETTLAFWRRSWRYPTAGEIVLPHAGLVRRARAPATPPGPLRIAYLGAPAAHKGWPVFAELMARHVGDDRYAFVHLGSKPVPGAPAEFHAVTVTPGQPDAMQRALERTQADVALIWPLCRETFSFVAYEAAAAGAAVLTGPDSGNVAAFVSETGHGRLLQSEAELFEAFASGAVLELARGRREAWLYDLRFSAMTADLLRSEAAA